MQKSYQIKVCAGKNQIWDSGVVERDTFICVRYAGEDLAPMTQYSVEITVTDNHGGTANIEGTFETGLISYENMKADWITHGFEDELELCAVFSKKFSLKGEVEKVRVYASERDGVQYRTVTIPEMVCSMAQNGIMMCF